MKRENPAFNMNFLLLTLARTVSDMGTGMQAVIIPLYIIDIGRSAATVGLFSFLSLMPALLVYPFAGVLGDRSNRKLITIATDLASAVLLLGLAFAAHADRMSLSLLFTVQVLVALLFGFFDPASKGMLPQLVPQNNLTRANSLLATVRILSVMLSSVIGAVLYSRLGISVVILINGISFLISAASSLLIRYHHVNGSASSSSSLLKDLAEGIRFIRNNKVIRTMCAFFLVVFALIQPIFAVVLPLFFKTRLAYSDTQYGYLRMIIVLGGVLGSILVGIIFGKDKTVIKPLAAGCGLLMFTILVFAALLFPQCLSLLGSGTLLYFVLLSGFSALVSAAVMFVNIPVQTYIQRSTPNEYMSRVFAIVEMISKGGMPIGALIYGLILTRLPVHWTGLISALLTIFISAAFMASLLKASELKQYSQELSE